MKITPEYLTFLLGAVAVPTIIVFLNFMVRGLKRWYYTAGTDFLVCQMTFSFSSAVLSKDMAPYIHNPFIKAAAPAIFFVLGMLILISWIWTASTVENEINQSIRRKTTPSFVPQVKLFISWLLVIVFFVVEILSFVSA
jgi:hypothetical protein